MSRIELSEFFKATPERTFEVFTDLERLPDRIEAIMELEVLTDGPVGVGTRFREKRMMFKREAVEEMEFSEYDPPNRFVLVAESNGSRYEVVHAFTAEGEGTRVDMTFTAEALSPMSRFISAMVMPFFKGATRNALLKDMQELKSAVGSSD